uniref:Uncharacterized protein n=1 Tax=Anopheles culicifacies TaxID=139723 RepID=A0A182MCF3_9DIPT
MLLANPGGGTGGTATGSVTASEVGGHGGRSSISSAGTVVASSSGTSGTAASHTMTAAGPSTSASAGGGCTGSTVRTPNVYDICHPLVMENPATSAGSIGPLQGHPLAPLPPLRNSLEPESSRSLRRLNI